MPGFRRLALSDFFVRGSHGREGTPKELRQRLLPEFFRFMVHFAGNCRPVWSMV